METMNLNFDCIHNQVEGTMTCSWTEGRVQLVEHFETATTVVLVDGVEKCRHDGLSIEQFVKLQCECERVAAGLKEGGAL